MSKILLVADIHISDYTTRCPSNRFRLYQGSRTVAQNIIEVALDYLSAGLDPEKVNIFIQSEVTELTELTFYYMNLVTLSRLERNPTVKTEIQLRNFETSIPVGFLTVSTPVPGFA